jgi:hypothetical protein
MKYLFSGLAAGAITFALPSIWRSVSVHALGYELQSAIVVGLAAIAGGIVGDKLGFGGGAKK